MVRTPACRVTGRHYGLVRAHRMDDAEYALVGLGSMMETAEATTDWLRSRGMRIGVISLRSFRPFPSRLVAELLAPCRAASVIERLDVPLAQSNPLTVEVKAALADFWVSGDGRQQDFPAIYSGIAGMGGRDVRPGHFIAAAENMSRQKGKSFFVLGVRHADALEIAAVASELFHLHAQALPKYGSEKKGLPTSYYLTLAPQPIRLHAELKDVEFVAVQDPNAFFSIDPLEGLRSGGTIYLQTGLAADQAWSNLPAGARAAIRERKLRVFTLDALRIARESSSRAELKRSRSSLPRPALAAAED